VNALGDLVLSKVSKRIADFTVRADFTVKSGERVALTGRSGSGKTTLFRLIAGLEKLDEGSVKLGEREISLESPARREIGVVFQEHALFPALNVLQNAAFGLAMRGVGRADREAQAEEWLARVGLKPRLHSPIGELSGGERQRVAFVRAVIWKPKLLLLDEPFSALDPSLRGALRRELVLLHELWPAPLLVITHDEADIREVATRTLELREGTNGMRTVG